MANSSGVIFVIGLVVVASVVWKMIAARLEEVGHRRRQSLLLEKLAANFPDVAEHVGRFEVDGIYQAMDRRLADLHQAWKRHLHDEQARENATGVADDNWKALDEDDWPRASYFRPFLSEAFCNKLDQDLAAWRLFCVCVENANHEGFLASERVWVGDDGKIKRKSLENLRLKSSQ
ncbi:MAG: hypothetical protein KDJ36_00145 [Hyphomicrobiaceae bacterium]|nr:hypothetical protein [Hyphomicrobiaceae bacterium]